MELAFTGMLCLMITAEQCRAARALLDWGQAELAEKAGVGIVTIRQLEAGGTMPAEQHFR